MWPGAQVRLFRRTYPELEESHIRWIQQEVGPPLAEYNIVRHDLIFANGSVLGFRHAHDDRTVFGYNTAEWSALLIDQAEAFTEFQLRFLRSRVRQPRGIFDGSPGGPWRPIKVYTANPGGASHEYLRAGWRIEDPATPHGSTFTAQADDGGATRAYLPARLRDNPSLDAEQYRKTLLGLPDALVAAYLEGDWSVVLGAFFRSFRVRDVDGNPWHVWPERYARERYDVPDDAAFPPKGWVRWAAVDGGYRDPWCVLWLARDPAKGRVFVYREQYGTRVEIPDQARAIAAACAEHEWERPSVIYADPSMFNRRANLTVSDAEVYAGEGVALAKGNNVRATGWRRLSQLIQERLDDGLPRLVLLERAAPQLQRTLPLLLTDPMRREDVAPQHGRHDPDSEFSIRDDPADALRYGIVPLFAATREVRVAEVRPYVDGAAPHGSGLLGAPKSMSLPGSAPAQQRLFVREKGSGRLVEVEALADDGAGVAASILRGRDDAAELARLGYTGVKSAW
jgi:hypothetical protein